MYNPTFSICIPNYNYAHYIGETIQSVLDQSYPHFEIIIADNASTDNSIEVIQSFKDERIRLIQNNYNVGFAPNLQKATEQAQMDFVNLLSSDDKMRPNALEEYAAIIRANEAQRNQLVLFSDANLIDGESKYNGYTTRNLSQMDAAHRESREADPSKELEEFGKTLTFSGTELMKLVLPNLKTFAPFLTVVYARALWNQVEGYHAIRTIGPDKFFNFKLLSLNPTVFYLRKPLFEYRVHGSINAFAQRRNLKQQIDDYFYTLEYSEDFLKPYHLDQKTLKQAYLDRICFRAGMTDLAAGNYIHAWQMLFFGLAAYPKLALGRARFYMLLSLLFLGPLSKPLIGLAKRIRK